jgi:hypothetical protein
MLAGNIPFIARAGSAPIVDANTVALLKCDGKIGINNPSFTDYVNPSRTYGTGVNGGNGIINQSSIFGSCFFTAGGGAGLMAPVNDPAFDLTGDFTVDFWHACANTTFAGFVVGRHNGYLAGRIGWFFWQSGTDMYFYASSDGVNYNIANGLYYWAGVDTNYHHYALCRSVSAASWYIYKDGVRMATIASALAPFNPPGVNFAVNFCTDAAGNSNGAGGWYDEIRISNIARYGAANFTPQTTPYYGPLSGGNDAATKFLFHADGANGSTSFVDSSAGRIEPHPLTASGTAQISTAQSKFGGSSLRLDGSTNCRVSTPYSSDFDVHLGDFTIEFWWYPTADSPGGVQIWGKRSRTGQYCSFMFFQMAGNVVLYASSGGTSWDGSAGTAVGAAPLNQWTHFVVMRKDRQLRFFRNGVTTFAPAGWNIYLWLTTDDLSLGGTAGGADCATGYLDEVRISDVARWSADFTPPTAAYT